MDTEVAEAVDREAIVAIEDEAEVVDEEEGEGGVVRERMPYPESGNAQVMQLQETFRHEIMERGKGIKTNHPGALNEDGVELGRAAVIALCEPMHSHRLSPTTRLQLRQKTYK